MKKVLKWIGILIGSVIVLLILVGSIVYLVAGSKLNKTYQVQVRTIQIPSDEASIARGKHIIEAITPCQECHGEDLSGEVMIDDPVFATIYSANLTPGKGGAGSSFTDEDWIRALRYGVTPEGKGLLIMPVEVTSNFSDQDLGALIAYLKTIPPVDHEIPPKRFGFMGRLFTVLGQIPPLAPDMVANHPVQPEAVKQEATSAYGEYLISVAACRDCHGVDLSGGTSTDPNGPPNGPNLTPAGELVGWTEADFFKAIQTGIKPSGTQLTEDMPWKYYKNMTDDELKAIWMYLETLPATQTSDSN
jgi:cytochrome c553